MGVASAYARVCDRIRSADFRVRYCWFKTMTTLSLDSVCLTYCPFIRIYFEFSNAQSAYYKVLMASAATSALRLHQRMPRIALTREYLALLLMEDSCHYLLFSMIFLYVSPFILILLPVILFGILHAASYSLTLLDVTDSERSRNTEIKSHSFF